MSHPVRTAFYHAARWGITLIPLALAYNFDTGSNPVFDAFNGDFSKVPLGFNLTTFLTADIALNLLSGTALRAWNAGEGFEEGFSNLMVAKYENEELEFPSGSARHGYLMHANPTRGINHSIVTGAEHAFTYSFTGKFLRWLGGPSLH